MKIYFSLFSFEDILKESHSISQQSIMHPKLTNEWLFETSRYQTPGKTFVLRGFKHGADNGIFLSKEHEEIPNTNDYELVALAIIENATSIESKKKFKIMTCKISDKYFEYTSVLKNYFENRISHLFDEKIYFLK